MRKPVIAGNWKMYKLIAESVQTAVELKPLVANANHCEVVIAPVFTALKTVADRLEGSNVHVAGQDCSTETRHGAHTGEVAADMLKDAGASHVIVGHSERRQHYHESDDFVNRKSLAGLAAGLSGAPFKAGRFPVFANATAGAVQQPDDARRLLAEQLTAPVRWVGCMQAIAAAHPGARYVEVGPGAVLGGLLKRIVPGAECTSLGTADDVERFLA
jgi:malonyl CoA-acyl carrier protein transacylase